MDLHDVSHFDNGGLFLPAVEEGFLPGFEFVCAGCDCICKLYELAAERDLTEEQDEGIQP